MKSFLIAFQFLTIFPTRVSGAVTGPDFARSSSAFVVVGAIQGILLIVTEYAAGELFHPDIVAALIVLVLVVSNGGFHLDGLADTFDGLAVKSCGDGEKDRERRLAVMKDSATGAIGVTAVVFAVLLKYLAVRSVADLLPLTYYSTLLLMPAFSKWTMVVAMFQGKPAREDGLGTLFSGNVGPRQLGICTLSLIGLLACVLFFFGRFGFSDQYLQYAAQMCFFYLACRAWVMLCNTKFGGLTGDTFGAVGETSDVLFLLTVLVWSRLSI
jgi:adenosylcobinamide-GDP ribazoletransferase